MTAVTGSVLRVIPLEAAEYAHRMVRAEKAAAGDQVYTPKFFSAHLYKTLQISVPDDHSVRRHMPRARSKRARPSSSI